MSHKIIFISFIYILFSCADEPLHTNVFDPNTPNDPPDPVELRTDLITAITNESITFGWTESGEEDFFSYNIYRSTDPGVDTSSALIGRHLHPFLNTDEDMGLQPNTSYYYKIYTEDKGGLSSGGNELRVNTSPNIYYAGRLVTDGGGTENLYHYSKTDAVVHHNETHLCFAVLEKNWDLFLDIRAFATGDPLDDGSSLDWAELIIGDTDGDNEPDMYEIFANSNPYDSEDIPTYDISIYPHVTPNQVVVYKGAESSATTVFVFFRHGDHYEYSKIIKFTGNWDEQSFTLDTAWFDQGVLRLERSNAIAKYSEDKLLVAEGRQYRILDLSGNELFAAEVEVYIGIMAVGKESPNGDKRIYLNNWSGEIFKYDESGNFLTSWQAFKKNTGTLVPLGMFADNRGNVFVTDTGLNTVNRYDSEGNFISRWEGINTDFHYFYHFDEQVAIYNQASISGDNSNLFVVDMNSYRSRATY